MTGRLPTRVHGGVATCAKGRSGHRGVRCDRDVPASPHLVGIDFDIEGGQTQSDIQNLVNAAAGAQSQYPNLQFSFTE